MATNKAFKADSHARHFGFTLNLVFMAQWFRLGGNVAHYLTLRYNSLEFRRRY